MDSGKKRTSRGSIVLCGQLTPRASSESEDGASPLSLKDGQHASSSEHEGAANSLSDLEGQRISSSASEDEAFCLHDLHAKLQHILQPDQPKPKLSRFKKRLSKVLKAPRKNQTPSSASSVHTRDDVSMDRSFRERKPKTESVRDAILRRKSRVAEILDRRQSEALQGPSQQPGVAQQRDAELPAAQQHEAAPQAAAPRDKGKRRSLLDRFSRLRRADETESQESLPVPEGNASDDIAVDDNRVSDKKRGKRTSVADLLSGKPNSPKALTHQSAELSHGQGAAEQESSRRHTRRRSMIDLVLFRSHRQSENAKDVSGLAGFPYPGDCDSKLPLPNLGPRDLRLSIQASLKDQLEVLTHPTERRVMLDVMRGMTRGYTIRRANSIAQASTTVVGRSEAGTMRRSYQRVECEQGAWVVLRSGRRVWLPHLCQSSGTPVELAAGQDVVVARAAYVVEEDEELMEAYRQLQQAIEERDRFDEEWDGETGSSA